MSIKKESLDKLEREYQFEFPEDIKELLLSLACGSINDLHFLHTDMIYPYDEENGAMNGYVAIATDILGNYFAFNPNSDNPNQIYYYSHDPLGYGVCAKNVTKLLEAFVNSNFDIL